MSGADPVDNEIETGAPDDHARPAATRPPLRDPNRARRDRPAPRLGLRDRRRHRVDAARLRARELTPQLLRLVAGCCDDLALRLEQCAQVLVAGRVLAHLLLELRQPRAHRLRDGVVAARGKALGLLLELLDPALALR